MKSKLSKMYEMLNEIKLRIVFQSILIGIVAGIIISIYRLVLDHVMKYTYEIYRFLGENKLYIILGIVVLMLMGYIVGSFVKDESMISGSGIPQIEGILTGHFKEPSPVKVLIYKFVGGVIAIGSGLSLGIEGPSIQLGATVADLYGRITKRLKIEKRFLISSGAGAGLAAAFNAPFAGVMFVLEEVHKKFTPILFVSAIAASVSSDMVTWVFFGKQPILFGSILKPMPAKDYPYLIVLGIIMGFAGVIYNLTLVKTMGLYSKLKISIKYRMMIPFVCAMFFGICFPQVLGGGCSLINSILVTGMALKIAIVLLIAKFAFSMISFCSSTPGGILFPLLTLGSLVGVIFGNVSIRYCGVNPVYMINFILFAMAAMFASIVRAPITGLILVCEMSGSFTEFGAIALVCGIAYLTAELLKNEPIYESLFNMRYHNQTGIPNESDKDLIISYIVEMGSSIVGKKLKEIKLVEHALVVSIEREGESLIPNGDDIIMAGDTINIMVSEKKEIKLRERLDKICICEEEYLK
ncbi:ClC family H(+)/Cl(-) exchange transporter [Clostridium sp.]|uniref:ClC family H(+)/Cl(-) exchange transporter n=1 Tax=Clostridium sp. TaxID=1506 RepID=UPI003992A474